MKEVKYNDNLKNDIECWKCHLQEKDDQMGWFILKTSVVNLVIFAGFILFQHSFDYSSLIWIISFGVVEPSAKLFFQKYSSKKVIEIENRLNHLVTNLYQYGVEVEMDELVKSTVLEENCCKEVYVEEDYRRNYLVKKKENNMYFSLLDKNKQIQILKMVREEIINQDGMKRDDDWNLFLLEEEDVNLLDCSLKRVLKKGK